MVAKEFIKMIEDEGINCRSCMKLVFADECKTFKELLEKLKLENGKWEMETDAQFDVETLTKM